MNENEIEHYNKKMAQHFPQTLGAAAWWWNIITKVKPSAVIHEEELHSAVEYAKNCYKKCFELDENLSKKTKESYKTACDCDLSIIEQFIIKHELEEIAPHLFRHKGVFHAPFSIPDWVKHLMKHSYERNVQQ
ncbi:MAG: hypothetical protein IJL38_03030 [Bacteroidales bacterium]|nr:hypothetical protein [Bacteroidales bacterium]